MFFFQKPPQGSFAENCRHVVLFFFREVAQNCVVQVVRLSRMTKNVSFFKDASDDDDDDGHAANYHTALKVFTL